MLHFRLPFWPVKLSLIRQGSDLVVLGRLADLTTPALTVGIEYTDLEGQTWSERLALKLDNEME